MPRPNCKLRDVSAFVAAGNFFEGDATGASLKSRIEWEGSGNTLILGADGKQRDVVFQLCGKAKIEIGPRCEITGTFRADARSRIAMGSDCRVNRPSVIRSCEGGLVQIGNGCLFANVMIRNSDLHAVIDMAANARVNAGADIILDDRVWLAEDVYVYKGVTIGKKYGCCRQVHRVEIASGTLCRGRHAGTGRKDRNHMEPLVEPVQMDLGDPGRSRNDRRARFANSGKSRHNLLTK